MRRIIKRIVTTITTVTWVITWVDGGAAGDAPSVDPRLETTQQGAEIPLTPATAAKQYMPEASDEGATAP